MICGHYLPFLSISIVIFSDREPELDAGGSALNTCKILRALGQDGLLFCGAIGDPAVDKNAETITQLINEARVTHW